MERRAGDRSGVGRLIKGAWVVALIWAALYWLRDPDTARVSYDDRPAEPAPAHQDPDRAAHQPDAAAPRAGVPQPVTPVSVIPDSGSGEATAQATRYVIRPGDTLWEISRELLGRGSRWREIYDANRAVIPDPDRPPVGVEIVIPAR